jgi:hypothetical protein
MLPAAAAELLDLEALRHRLPVLGLRIIPLFAIAALHRNDFPGHLHTPIKMLNLEVRMPNLLFFLLLHSSF